MYRIACLTGPCPSLLKSLNKKTANPDADADPKVTTITLPELLFRRAINTKFIWNKSSIRSSFKFYYTINLAVLKNQRNYNRNLHHNINLSVKITEVKTKHHIKIYISVA